MKKQAEAFTAYTTSFQLVFEGSTVVKTVEPKFFLSFAWSALTYLLNVFWYLP